MTRSIPTIETAHPDDVGGVHGLLEANQLPLSGFAAHVTTALVARVEGRIVGAAAIEPHADGALLRSVVVAADRRGGGLGARLVSAALALARSLGAPSVYLLTTTADGYFGRFGFEVVERTEVPAGVRTSVEFQSACPSTAVVMRRILSA